MQLFFWSPRLFAGPVNSGKNLVEPHIFFWEFVTHRERISYDVPKWDENEVRHDAFLIAYVDLKAIYLAKEVFPSFA